MISSVAQFPSNGITIPALGNLVLKQRPGPLTTLSHVFPIEPTSHKVLDFQGGALRAIIDLNCRFTTSQCLILKEQNCGLRCNSHFLRSLHLKRICIAMRKRPAYLLRLPPLGADRQLERRIWMLQFWPVHCKWLLPFFVSPPSFVASAQTRSGLPRPEMYQIPSKVTISISLP